MLRSKPNSLCVASNVTAHRRSGKQRVPFCKKKMFLGLIDFEGEKLSVDCTKLLDSLLCTVCCTLMQCRIYQCSEGHSFCSKCTAKLRHCPACRSDSLYVRNRKLESILECISNVRCKYSAAGCRKGLMLSDKAAHEANCYYRPLHCTKCAFKGGPDALVQHLVEVHNFLQIKSSRLESSSIALCDLSRTILSCHSRHFIFGFMFESFETIVCIDNPIYRHGYGNRFNVALQSETGCAKNFTGRAVFWRDADGYGSYDSDLDIIECQFVRVSATVLPSLFDPSK